MPSDSNKVQLIGHVVETPLIKRVGAGKIKLANLLVMVNTPVGQESREYTIEITCWASKADEAAETLSMCDKIMVLGCVTSRSYTDRNDVERIAMNIKCESIKMLEKSSPLAVGRDLSDPNEWDAF